MTGRGSARALALLAWLACALPAWAHDPAPLPALDFTGATAARTGLGVAAGYASATAALLTVAWTARQRQLTS